MMNFERLKDVGQFIAGEERPGAGESFQSLYPGTGEVLCDVRASSVDEVSVAVDSAQAGFRVWSQWSGAQRGRVLVEAARILRSRVETLARLEVLDTGKPISEALSVDIHSAADALEYFGGVAPSVQGDFHQLGASFGYTRREPLGVCAGIGAWNYPLQIAAWKAAPALACGNAMVFKPSELSPVTAIELAKIFHLAGMPQGVFNVVQGTGAVGRALVSHPGVAKVSLTGSVPTGLAVMAEAAKTLKTVTLELGGKSPLVVFEDARLEQAVSAALLANFYTQGEICSNGTRVFVHESRVEAFLDLLLPRVQALRVGDPLDPRTQMGALISHAHRAKVLSAIEQGKKENARLLCGGAVPKWDAHGSHQKLNGGYFVQPTVFSGCADEMTLVKEEIFGPVMAILTFRDEEEVIRRANATDFGLAAGVFTQDIQRAHRVISRLEAGTCWINNYNITPVEMPFGGMKRSGIGRENSLAAIQHYSQLKSVYVEMGDVQSPF